MKLHPSKLSIKELGLVVCFGILIPASAATIPDSGVTPTSVASQEQPGDGNAVTHWNGIATGIFSADPGPILDGRALAVLHAAIHDAVNGVDRRYEPYTADLSSPEASVEAAVAAAAREVLLALSPSQTERIEAEYVTALAEVPDGPAKNDGVILGRQSAQVNLDRRTDDGIATVNEPVYVPTGEPGDYDFTPPFDRPPLGAIAFYPGFGQLTPFGIELEEHRLRGPDRLSSRRYALDFNFLKSIGRLDSPTRTDDQTEIAFFWFEGLPIWNSIARTVIRQHHADVWGAARILALLNFAMADGLIACFEAKYHFRFWRPYTAIRRAGEDGNPFTEADADWLPLLWTSPEVIPPPFFIPPIPEYPSAAAVVAAAAAEVLIRTFGDRESFETTSPTLPGETRRFRSFTEARLESGFSRVYGGIHFVRAVRDGFRQGKGVGADISRLLPRVRH
jgi:hypothetical protein